MGEDFGQRLRRLRREARLSQSDLAHSIYVSQSLISKIETGAETPSRAIAEACDRVLSGRGELLELRPAAPIDVEDSQPWELADLITRSSISIPALDCMLSATLEIARRYPRASPTDMLPLVGVKLKRLRQVLQHPQPVSVRLRAVSVLGLLGGIIGNLHLDIGRPAEASGYFGLGKLAGQEAGDDDLLSWVLATESIDRYFHGAYDASAELLDRATALASTRSSRRRLAWISALSARTHAAMQSTSEALRALEEAYLLIDAAGVPCGVDFFDVARLDGIAGATHMRLGRISDADEMLRRSLAARAASDYKGRALIVLDLANCRAMDADWREARALLGAAQEIAGTSPVAPIAHRIAVLRERIPAARD